MYHKALFVFIILAGLSLVANAEPTAGTYNNIQNSNTAGTYSFSAPDRAAKKDSLNSWYALRYPQGKMPCQALRASYAKSNSNYSPSNGKLSCGTWAAVNNNRSIGGIDSVQDRRDGASIVKRDPSYSVAKLAGDTSELGGQNSALVNNQVDKGSPTGPAYSFARGNIASRGSTSNPKQLSLVNIKSPNSTASTTLIWQRGLSDYLSETGKEISWKVPDQRPIVTNEIRQITTEKSRLLVQTNSPIGGAVIGADYSSSSRWSSSG